MFGAPIDLALLDAPTAHEVAGGLRRTLVDTGRRVAVNYRVHYDAETQRGAIALDPSTNDRGFLVTALSLARVERSRAEGDARRALDDLHERIWEKLCAMPTPPMYEAPNAMAAPPA